MQTSIKGLVELAGHEGICLSPYLDSVGVWTIGVGATKSEIPGLNSSHPDITISQAFDLFKKSIVKYEDAVNKALHVPVLQPQFDALVSICYNIGTGGLKGSTFVKRINAGAALGSLPMGFVDLPLFLSELSRTEPNIIYAENVVMGFTGGTIVDAIMMWTKPKEITERRKREARLYSKALYSNKGMALVFPVNSKNKPVYSNGKSIKVEEYL